MAFELNIDCDSEKFKEIITTVKAINDAPSRQKPEEQQPSSLVDQKPINQVDSVDLKGENALG